MRIIGAGTREGFQYTVTDSFWTVPNLVTIARFLLVPVFVWFVVRDSYIEAFWVLVVLGGTDWVDGYIARRFDQMSTVGHWLDPLADRISMAIVTVTLVVSGVAPLWLVLAVIVPDIVLFLNSLIVFNGSPELPVTVLGKVRTAILMVAAPLVLLAWGLQLEESAFSWLAEGALMLGCAAHVVASVHYFVMAQRKAKKLKADGIAPRDREQWSLKNTS